MSSFLCFIVKTVPVKCYFFMRIAYHHVIICILLKELEYQVRDIIRNLPFSSRGYWKENLLSDRSYESAVKGIINRLYHEVVSRRIRKRNAHFIHGSNCIIMITQSFLINHFRGLSNIWGYFVTFCSIGLYPDTDLWIYKRYNCRYEIIEVHTAQVSQYATL